MEKIKFIDGTQTETQNSNLTFEKRTMLDCYNCKRYKSDDACVECRYEPKGEPQPDWHYDEQDATWYPYKHEDEPQTERERASDGNQFA